MNRNKVVCYVLAGFAILALPLYLYEVKDIHIPYKKIRNFEQQLIDKFMYTYTKGEEV